MLLFFDDTEIVTNYTETGAGVKMGAAPSSVPGCSKSVVASGYLCYDLSALLFFLAGSVP